MIESQYTKAVHKKLPGHVYAWKINDNFAGGVPDAFYRSLLGGGTPLWVEYKFLKDLPKKDDTLVIPKLRPQQLHWLKQAVKAGEQAWVIVGCESVRIKNSASGFILQPTEWETGVPSEVARSRLMSTTDIAQTISNTVAAQ